MTAVGTDGRQPRGVLAMRRVEPVTLLILIVVRPSIILLSVTELQ